LGQAGSKQIHDFNPGIASSGLFWTTAFPSGNVKHNLDLGTAAMWATNWSIKDFTDIFNSTGIGPGPEVPAIPSWVSFSVDWTAIGPPTQLPNSTTPTTGFGGVFRDSTAQISWSANEPAAHFEFESDAASTSTTVSGVIGREKNGIFFSGEG